MDIPDKYTFPLIVGKLVNIFIIITFIFPLTVFALNPGSVIDAARYSQKVKYLQKLIKFGPESLKVSDLALASKGENIITLLEHATVAKKITQAKAVRYVKEFNSLDKGEEILLKCLQNERCNIENYLQIIKTSQLHKEAILLHPDLNLQQVNQRVGKLAENMMIRYFKRSGWTTVPGEIGRQGIDGLFVKKSANGVVTDVLIAESKYNTSMLQTTQSGKQMSKEWVLKKIQNLRIKYPENKEYAQIEQFISRDMHKSRLWRMGIKEDKITINLNKIDSLDDVVDVGSLKGGEKTIINYSGNSSIKISSPSNSFQEEIIKWYKEELNTL